MKTNYRVYTTTHGDNGNNADDVEEFVFVAGAIGHAEDLIGLGFEPVIEEHKRGEWKSMSMEEANDRYHHEG